MNKNKIKQYFDWGNSENLGMSESTLNEHIRSLAKDQKRGGKWPPTLLRMVPDQVLRRQLSIEQHVVRNCRASSNNQNKCQMSVRSVRWENVNREQDKAICHSQFHIHNHMLHDKFINILHLRPYSFWSTILINKLLVVVVAQAQLSGRFLARRKIEKRRLILA